MNIKKWVAFAVVAAAIVFALGADDMREARAQRELYCDMVKIWSSQEAQGIRPIDRAGWPPFKGDCK